MVPITNIMGRLGNQMFWYAFAYNYARMHGITDGYFPQNEAWFEESKEQIRLIFSQGIGTDPRVGIHVRRTDYLDPNRVQYGLSLDYYKQAMGHFPDAKFVICSDDIGWCMNQEIFKGCDFSFAHEIDDMNLLASCVGVIIANSSFSWWAAWLNPHNPKVIAPFKWDKDNKVFPMPTNWITI